MKDFNFSNVKINWALSPLYFLICTFILKRNPELLKSGYTVMNVSIISTLIYCWCSRFFQPDLDHETNRPGKTLFPVGDIACKAFYAFLKVILMRPFGMKKAIVWADLIVYGPVKLISMVWFYYWAPYANLLTHRGMSHWPVLGTLTRIWYLHFSTTILFSLSPNALAFTSELFNKFYFWNGIDGNFILYCLPVYLCDIFHTAGDATESMIKGYSFCPPQVKRGYLSKIFRITI